MREMESLRTLPQEEAQMPPSSMLSSGLGMMRSGSTRSWQPKPLQLGQAP